MKRKHHTEKTPIQGLPENSKIVLIEQDELLRRSIRRFMNMKTDHAKEDDIWDEFDYVDQFIAATRLRIMPHVIISNIHMTEGSSGAELCELINYQEQRKKIRPEQKPAIFLYSGSESYAHLQSDNQAPIIHNCCPTCTSEIVLLPFDPMEFRNRVIDAITRHPLLNLR